MHFGKWVFNGCFILHGRFSSVLVPMDVRQWHVDILGGHVASPQVIICSIFLRRPHGALFKLQQKGSINEYLSEFKRLANHIVGLAPPFLLSCFILGLTSKLHWKVHALQPFSLPQVVALAKLQEDKLHDRHCLILSTHFPTPVIPSTKDNSGPLPSTPTPWLPVNRLSFEDLVVHHDKGLCYHCEDKWFPGHRCKP